MAADPSSSLELLLEVSSEYSRGVFPDLTIAFNLPASIASFGPFVEFEPLFGFTPTLAHG